MDWSFFMFYLKTILVLKRCRIYAIPQITIIYIRRIVEHEKVDTR